MDQKTFPLIIGVVVVAVVVFGAFTLTQKNERASEGDTMQKEDAMMEEDTNKEEAMMTEGATEGSAMMQKGSYEPYAADKLALAAKGDVVLFFRASWCPTCRALDADIKANVVPEGVTILDVNYDTEIALKQKYGVTMQHTLVQVDAEGNLIQKWTGSPSLASLVAKVQ